MLYEYRSDDAAGLRGMDAAFRAAVETVRAKGTDVEIVHLGTRPCGEGVDPAAQQALTALCGGIVQAHTGRMPVIESASTDCNIPLSLGIPAVSFGLCRGGGAHTREEWVELSSLETGIAAAVETLLAVSR